jgi:predicted membrane metal-binding protein
MPYRDIDQTAIFISSQNEALRGSLGNQSASVRAIARASMKEPDEAMNLAIFNAERILLANHQTEILATSYQPQVLRSFHTIPDQLVCPLIF